jgi:hypothetical protein
VSSKKVIEASPAKAKRPVRTDSAKAREKEESRAKNENKNMAIILKLKAMNKRIDEVFAFMAVEESKLKAAMLEN